MRFGLVVKTPTVVEIAERPLDISDLHFETRPVERHPARKFFPDRAIADLHVAEKRFGAVGASGYAVNLISFAVLVHLVGVTYWVASPIAYLLGTANNFYWNRRWTFSHAREVHYRHQAWKFFAVSLLSFGVNYAVLITLVRTTGMEQVLAQAIANAVGMPVNFLGQKLWSFKL